MTQNTNPRKPNRPNGQTQTQRSVPQNTQPTEHIPTQYTRAHNAPIHSTQQNKPFSTQSLPTVPASPQHTRRVSSQQVTQMGQAVHGGYTQPTRTQAQPPVHYAPSVAPGTGVQAPIAAPLVQPRRAAPPSKKSGSGWLIAGALALLGVSIIAIMGVLIMLLALAPDRVADGVTVAGIDLGGSTVEAAETQLAASALNPEIILVDGTRTFPARMSDFGASLDTARTLEAVQSAEKGADVAPLWRIDLAAAQEGFITRTETINIDALPDRSGRAMEIPVMLDRLRIDATGELADGLFELNMIEVAPPDPVDYAVATGQTSTHIVEQGQELALIAREYGVAMEDIARLNDISNFDFIYPGQELLIPASGEFIPADAPAAPYASGKSIVVDTNAQRIYAYENGQLVRSHLTSTGRAETPTVLGDYSVYVKYTATDMSGPGYFLPQVPYTMYFYQGYGIHGTYWHNSFGRQMSHGCVNLPTAEAEWFFNWAQVGTPVRVI